jgi:ferredoxin
MFARQQTTVLVDTEQAKTFIAIAAHGSFLEACRPQQLTHDHQCPQTTARN